MMTKSFEQSTGLGNADKPNSTIAAHLTARPSTDKSTAIAHPKTLVLKGLSTMHDTEVTIETHVYEHTPAHYTAQAIAQAHGVKDVTVRTRWFNWLCKVAPTPLLKTDAGYTELAKALFDEFAKVDAKERPAWVADAKRRYSAEWGSVGVIDCEVMPDNVGNALSLLTANTSAIQQTIALELDQVGRFIDQLNVTDCDFSQAEIEQAIAAGTQKAIAQFKAEEIARVETLNALRQRRIGGQP
jgi:hypothetical protein